jgi:multidrug transporter EmrE-like cation transporter
MSEVDLTTAIIGISLAIFTTFCFNLGIVYQKKGLKEAKLQGVEIKTEEGFIRIIKTFGKLFTVRSWLIGAIMGIIGWFPYIISIGMVGVLVTEPVMATGFIFFVPAAMKILKERVGIIEYLAIGLLTISPILIGFAGISDVDLDLIEFVPSLIIFLAISLSICIFSLTMAKKKRGKSIEGLFIMFGGAILFALGGSATNILAQALQQTGEGFQWYTLFELPFGIFWFLFGGGVAHLWIFLGFWMMAAFNISSLPYYQGGFQKGKILIMYPILDSIALLLPITAGIFVFKQTFSNFPLFFIALICSVFATIVLSKYQAAVESNDSIESDSDKEISEPTKQTTDLE